MMLTAEQCEWIKKEKEILERVIEAKERSKTNAGIMRDYIRLDTINFTIELHNVAMKKHNADIAAEKERQARIEKGKERLKENKSDSDSV